MCSNFNHKPYKTYYSINQLIVIIIGLLCSFIAKHDLKLKSIDANKAILNSNFDRQRCNLPYNAKTNFFQDF